MNVFVAVKTCFHPLTPNYTDFTVDSKQQDELTIVSGSSQHYVLNVKVPANVVVQVQLLVTTPESPRRRSTFASSIFYFELCMYEMINL